MDEDIDIEEHDLLDNPQIRKIFPDLRILKEEIPEATHVENVELNSHLLNDTEDVVTTSKISNSNNQQINLSDTDAEPDIIFVEKRQPPLFSNKIILGSKPSFQCKIEVEAEEITEKVYSSRLILVDISSYLQKSGKFCKICLIHFPHKEGLQHHMKEKHNKEISLESCLMKENIIPMVHRYKCDKCPKDFMKHGNLIKHYRNVHHYSNKKKTVNTEKTLRRNVQIKRGLTKLKYNNGNLENKCFHCKKKFPSKKRLIDHIYTILRTKNRLHETRSKEKPDNSTKHIQQNKMKTMLTKRKSKEVDDSHKKITLKRRVVSQGEKREKKISNPCTDTTPFLFKCMYCSYYFRSMKICINHIENKHKDTTRMKLKPVLFDGQCKYCSLKSNSWISYNGHLLQLHGDNVNKTFKIEPKLLVARVEIALATKPNDISLSNDGSNSFSEDDSEITNPLETIADVENHNILDNASKKLVLKSVIFKCKRCDINFLTSQSTINHKDHMEMLINWKCHICNNIFKKEDEVAHLKQHLVCSEITLITLDVSDLERALYKCSKCTVHFPENEYFLHSQICHGVFLRKKKCKECKILIDKSVASYHFKDHRFIDLKPKDFTIIVSDVIVVTSTEYEEMDKIDNNTKDIIKSCSAGKIEGSLKNNVKLENMSLKMAYCGHCKCFVSLIHKRHVHIKARCTQIRPIVCKYCGLMLTAKSVVAHRLLHQRKKDLKLQNFTFYDINTLKQIMPPVPEYPKCCKCDVHLISKVALLSHVCSEAEFLTCHICNMKLLESVFKLHMSFHYYSKTNLTNLEPIILNDEGDNVKYNSKVVKTKQDKRLVKKSPECSGATKVSINTLSKINPGTRDKNKIKGKITSSKEINDGEGIDVASNKIPTQLNQTVANGSIKKSDYELFDVLYCCASCHAMTDTYDKVVEHCQSHICGVSIEIENCSICEMVVERKSHTNHSNSSQKPIDVLTFDTFYFVLSIDIWLEHIFESISKEKKELILHRSIYRKSKIKMKVMQDGPPDLTVYKCNICCYIVDPDSTDKHSETSCFKLRKYPCSHCGLPFLTPLSRSEHEHIHMAKNITLKSYRILTFNNENDKADNKLINKSSLFFFLYQCRNCNVIIDKYKRTNHKCIIDNMNKCETCDLLILSSDYRSHCIKHKKVASFVQRNMKVVLFGQTGLESSSKTGDKQDAICFDGTFIDYTFYMCEECEVCFEKSQIMRGSHGMCPNIPKTKCLKCDLFIAKKRIGQHLKLHKRYVDFVRENINIVPFSASNLQANFVPVGDGNFVNKPNIQNISEDNDLDEYDFHINSKTIEDTLANNNTVSRGEVAKPLNSGEQIAKLLKCMCGLHFLDSSSMQTHLKSCNPRMHKQRCSKCSFHFTPNVLFDHLLLHHGNKNLNYKFNIVEVSDKKNQFVTIYRCANCKTHFGELKNAKAHCGICKQDADAIEKERCRKCSLFFDISSIELHESEHHKDIVADIDIVDIKQSVETSCKEIETFENSIDDDISLLADLVIDSKNYRLSEKALSQIDLSRYDNCIYKCEICNTHFLVENTLRRHFAHGHVLSPQETCHICGLTFSLQSLTKHIYIHHKQMKLNFSDFVLKT